MTDDAIIHLYRVRDEHAIDATKEKYERYLSAIAMNILSDREDSAESVNDTYLAAWNSIPPHHPSVLSTYLGKLTRRIAIDIFRKRHRQKRYASEAALSLDELSECIPANSNPEVSAETTLLANVINDFVRTLSTEERHLFVGRYYYLDPLKTVAAYCQMSESKAKSKLFRIRQKLKEHLQKEGFAV